MRGLSVFIEQNSEAEKLCALLLELAGRGPGRMATARRHAHILDAAMMHMNAVQRAEARRRIIALETKWVRCSPENTMIRKSTAFHRKRELLAGSPRGRFLRYLHVLHRAASKIANGETCLSNVMDYAFAIETDHVLSTVGFDSFVEWLTELRIARRQERRIYVPGTLCNWWVSQMSDKGSAYHACLELSERVQPLDSATTSKLPVPHDNRRCS